jgi:diguanylate cyclase (GGDEF)-like protein
MATQLEAAALSERETPYAVVTKPAVVKGRRPRPSLTFAFLCIGLVVAVASVSGVLGTWDPTVYLLMAVVTLAAFVFSIYRRHPSSIWPWLSITVAMGLFLAGGIARTELNTMGNLSSSRSLIPDVLSLPGYALLAFGLLGFSSTRIRGPHRHTSVVLDGLIAAFALAALAWVFAVQPVLLHHQTPITVRLVLTAYPSMSLFLVVVTLRIAFNPDQQRVPAFWFLVFAMTFMFMGDAVYMFADMNVIHVADRLLELPYLLTYVTAGTGALHPSMRRLTEPGKQRRMTTSRGRIALIAVALLIPPLLTLERPNFSTSDRVALVVIVVALTITTVCRIMQALHAEQRSQMQLVFEATHDSLTGLPNRRLLEEHLARLLKRAPIDDTHVALLFLDLDRFKLVNETLGHHHGDDLLVKVAQRLRAHVRPHDLVTRIGGDEFMIVLGHVVSVSQAVDLANRLRFCLRAPFVVNNQEFFVSASIGLAFASGEDSDITAEVLVRDADTAMNQAKDVGRDSVAVFDESMRSRVSERLELENDLRHAVDLHQLHLVFQPIVRLPDGLIEGMEALVRWSHPTHGVLLPAKFIPLAEESGLIKEIGNWVLEGAVAQLAAWRREIPAMEDIYISVNLSGAQLHDEGLVRRVADTLATHDLPGSSLCIELTESVLMDDPIAATEVLTQQRRLGVRLAIDDFGTEYSSLAYLSRFPVTSLKIDKSFVDTLVEDDTPDATLVAAIVAMAKALGVSTIAEGVETPAQLRRLIDLGCDSVQGFLYSRPVRAELLPQVAKSLETPGLQSALV